MSEKKLDFEQAIVRLEEIVKNLESGKVALNESLALYEEGVSIAKFCQAELKNIESKAAKILENNELKEFNVE